MKNIMKRKKKRRKKKKMKKKIRKNSKEKEMMRGIIIDREEGEGNMRKKRIYGEKGGDRKGK